MLQIFSKYALQKSVLAKNVERRKKSLALIQIVDSHINLYIINIYWIYSFDIYGHFNTTGKGIMYLLMILQITSVLL